MKKWTAILICPSVHTHYNNAKSNDHTVHFLFPCSSRKLPRQNSCNESNWLPALERCQPVAFSLISKKPERAFSSKDSAPHLITNCGWICRSSEHSIAAIELCRKCGLNLQKATKPLQIARAQVSRLGAPKFRNNSWFLLQSFWLKLPIYKIRVTVTSKFSAHK